jgi:hypothetical protein
LSPIVTRKRKVSIVCEQNQGAEIKRPTIDYIKQLDGKFSFLFSFEKNKIFRNEKSIYKIEFK